MALARLGKIFEEENDFDNAIGIYNQILSVQLTYESYVKIGDCYKKQGNLIQASQSYKEGLSIQQTSEIYQKMAEVSKMQHQYKKAYELYQSSLMLLSDDNSKLEERRHCFVESGKMCLLTDEYENAINSFKDALDIEETECELALLGDSFYGKGEYTDALEQYEKVMKMASEDVDEEDWELLEKIALCFDRK